MSKQYPTNMFFSLSGLHRDRSLLDQSGAVRHSVVHSDEDTGAMRALHLQLSRDAENAQIIRLTGNYLLHSDAEHNEIIEFLNVELSDVAGSITLDSARLLNQELDVDKPQTYNAIVRSLNQIYESIAKKHRWVNFLKPFKENEILPSPIGRMQFPGLYPSGEIKSLKLPVGNSNRYESDE